MQPGWSRTVASVTSRTAGKTCKGGGNGKEREWDMFLEHEGKEEGRSSIGSLSDSMDPKTF